MRFIWGIIIITILFFLIITIIPKKYLRNIGETIGTLRTKNLSSIRNLVVQQMNFSTKNESVLKKESIENDWNMEKINGTGSFREQKNYSLTRMLRNISKNDYKKQKKVLLVEQKKEKQKDRKGY